MCSFYLIQCKDHKLIVSQECHTIDGIPLQYTIPSSRQAV